MVGEGGGPIDYVALAAALLERAPVLVPVWLPEGYKHGRYWYVGDFDGSPGKSANVNLRSGAWGDNGRPGDSGRDLISLYGRIKGLSNRLAAIELMADNGWRQLQAPAPRERKGGRKADDDDGITWTPLHPVPEDAPDYRTQWAHYARGVPPLHWEYRDRWGRLLGLVVRFDKSDGTKDVQPISFCQGSHGHRQWKYRAFSTPRPLYGLWRLGNGSVPPPLWQGGQAPPTRVIVVEGEKKADALYAALAESVPVLSWPGGCRTVQLADWSALAGVPEVVCWPDADAQVDKKSQAMLPREKQPGVAAMRKVQQTLVALGCQVELVDVGQPGERDSGWDAADAIAEGWTREQLEAFMAQRMGPPEPAQPDEEAAEATASAKRPHLRLVEPTAAPAAAPGAPTPSRAARAGGGGGGEVSDPPRWQDGLVFQRGAIRECVANVMLVLHHHAQWQGVLAFDQFAQRVVKRRPAPYDPDGEPVPASGSWEWTDVDDTRTAAWIARHCSFVPSSAFVAEAASETAHSAPFHPVIDWLESLKHDGTERLEHWAIDHMGVADTPYARRVSRYFLVGMCMRVLHPGCKFDYCLVLEGPQGRMKSTALRTLGGEWFSDTELDLQHKDSMSYIRGKWLHEFGELGSLARSEEKRQKSFLSRQVDEFRPTYGRREIRCYRQTAFSGTTNEWQWNKDPTGGRRFWPLEVGEVINIAGLADLREQLFAEAYALAKAGERYWPDADEQRELFDPEQLAREAPDAYVELLGSWLDSPNGLLTTEFTLADACLSGLKLDAKSLTKDVQTRVGIALRKLGCERVERRLAANRFVYKRPARKAASSQPDAPATPVEEEVPF